MLKLIDAKIIASTDPSTDHSNQISCSRVATKTDTLLEEETDAVFVSGKTKHRMDAWAVLMRLIVIL